MVRIHVGLPFFRRRPPPDFSDTTLAFRTAAIHYTILFSTPLSGAFLT